MKIIQGETIEQQMKYLDKIIERVVKRSKTTVTGIITPYPISSYCQTSVNGEVLRYMFSTNGTLNNGVMLIEDMPKEGVTITVKSISGLQSQSVSTVTKKKAFEVPVDRKVSVGDRVVVYVEPVVEEENVSGIWVAFTWTPDRKDVDVKKYLLDEVLKLAEE